MFRTTRLTTCTVGYELSIALIMKGCGEKRRESLSIETVLYTQSCEVCGPSSLFPLSTSLTCVIAHRLSRKKVFQQQVVSCRV